MCNILYVPVMLEGLVIGKNSPPLADLAPDYSATAEIPLGKYATRLFGTKQEMPGIHLHWTMPDALLHGIHTGDDGEIRFPALPNRWIVQRIWAKNGEIRQKAWILESDFVTNHPLTGLEEYDRTSIPTFRLENGLWEGAGLDGQIYGYLGSARDYGTENQEEGYYLTELTVVGPGDASFAACYPKSRSVFGFYDSMEEEESGTYTYVLTGYYETGEKDPLTGADKETLEGLGWFCGDSEEIPQKTICHSVLKQVKWEGPEADYPSGVPTEDISVYIGNTSAEALAAFLQKELPEVKGLERMLNAFQNDMLEGIENNGNPDALIRLEEGLHEKQFESIGQGSVWGLRNTLKRTNHAELEEENYQELALMNELQEENNLLEAMTESLKNEIYFAWWKYVLAESDPWGDDALRLKEGHTQLQKDLEAVKNVDSKTFLSLIQKLLAKLKKHQKQIRENTQKIAELQKSLNDLLQGKEMTLQEKQRDRFYMASPPVLMFCGDGVKRAYKQGFQKNAADGLLHCRMHPVSSLDLTIDRQNVTITAKDAAELCAGTCKPLPSFAADVLGEVLLLSEDFAECIAQKAFQLAGILCTPEKLATVTNNICRKQREKTGFSGSFPDPISVCQWKQPWAPLLMEWRIQMKSARSDVQKDDSFRSYSLEEIDLELKRQEDRTTDSEPVEISGSTVISPHAADHLGNLIRRMAEEQRQGPEYENLKKAAEIAGEMEILSQRMDGFHEALIMRDHLPALPLYDSSKKLRPLLLELTRLLDQPLISPRVEDTESRFFPVRAGFLSVSEIWLVDSFGQMKKIKPDENRIFLGDDVSYEDRKGEAYLRPRFMHPATVRFHWLAARMEEERNLSMESIDHGTTPVLGFVIPNFLDGDFQVCDSCGRLLGFIQKSGQGARWMRPLPSCIPFEEIPSAHLRFFVKGLLGEHNPACANLLKYLDQVFGKSAPGGDEQFLQLCFGRPLVLARGSVQILGRGYPPHVQWFREELVCNGFDEEKFEVRFGDKRKLFDGLAGFYVGGREEKTYEKLFVPDLFSEPESEYMVQGSSIRTSLSDEPVELTFLMEPSGHITISTGFLPAKEVSLDKNVYCGQLEKNEMYIKAAPLLSPADPIAAPVPGGMTGEWSFSYVTPEGTETKTKEVREPDVWSFDERMQISEGFFTTAGKGRKDE